jgi:hypothetical protein
MVAFLKRYIEKEKKRTEVKSVQLKKKFGKRNLSFKNGA